VPSWLSWLIPEGWSGQDIAIAVAIFSISSAILSLVLVAVAVIQIPVDYFINPNPPRKWIHRHPIIRWTGLIVKNFLGACLVVVGMILSLPGVPGQGLLTIFVGLMLLDLPKKRQFETWMISRKGVLIAVNRLRARFGHLPLQMTLPFPQGWNTPKPD
jgi:hypothetical protein